MSETRLSVLTLPYTMESIAEPRELIVDFDNGHIYVKSLDGGRNIRVGFGEETGKLRLYQQHGTFDQDTTRISIEIPEYNPGNGDILQLYIGGIFKSAGIDYAVNVEDSRELFCLENEWKETWTYDIMVYKNIRPVPESDYFDGSMLLLDSVPDEILSNAAGQIKGRVNAHITDMTMHVSSEDRLRWDQAGKLLILEDIDIPGRKYQVVVKNEELMLKVVETNE